jgi:hypothetical protein
MARISSFVFRDTTFVFCETTLKQINDLPEELRLKFHEAVTNYGIYNIEPKFSGMENTVWISIKNSIDTRNGNG